MTDDAVKRLRVPLDRGPAASARAEQLKRQAQTLVATLHQDELVMLRHIIAGWSRAESAAELGIELHQLEKRRAGLLARLNAESTMDAIRVGIYAGLD